MRQIIRLGQKELAGLVGCSASTIQSIELRRLALSEELAQRISNATGIAADWLLEGDPKAEPWDCEGWPYREWKGKPTRVLESFLKHFKEEDAIKHAKRYVPSLAALILKAAKTGRWRLIEWQIENAITQLEKQYEITRPPKASPKSQRIRK